MTEDLPRLCFVAPMVAGHGDRVISQAETLARLFTADGYEVRTTSAVLNRPLRIVDMAASLARWRRTFDVVIVSAFSGAGFVVADMAVRLGRSLGKPVVVCLRGGDLPRFAARRPHLVRSALTRASAVVAPSGYLAQAFYDMVDVRVIPNVIDVDAYPFRRRSPARPHLLWMRSFEPLYNPEIAVRAMASIVATCSDAHLTMAGQPGESLGRCEALVREHGLGEVVSFAGFLSGTGKTAALNDHDIYLHTNRIDNMPVTVVEAAISGLAIVATRVGGIPFLLKDGKSALLVDVDNAEQLAAAVLRLVHDPELSGEVSTGARAVGERSGWPTVRAQWESLLAEIRDMRRSAKSQSTST